jgi:hypothetical protein
LELAKKPKIIQKKVYYFNIWGNHLIALGQGHAQTQSEPDLKDQKD